MHTYSRLHLHSAIYTLTQCVVHTHRVLSPRRRWAAGTVTLRMRNRNMRGPIKTGQGNTVTRVHPKVQTATFGSADDGRTDRQTDGRTHTRKLIEGGFFGYL